jgi:hypothetical protein
MVVRFIEEFDTSRIGKAFETVQDIHAVLFELINNGAAYRVGNPEVALVPPDQIQHDPVGGEVAFFSNLMENGAVFFFILISMAMMDVKKSIMPQSTRLMNLKVKTDTWHIHFLQDR